VIDFDSLFAVVTVATGARDAAPKSELVVPLTAVKGELKCFFSGSQEL